MGNSIKFFFVKYQKYKKLTMSKKTVPEKFEFFALNRGNKGHGTKISILKKIILITAPVSAIFFKAAPQKLLPLTHTTNFSPSLENLWMGSVVAKSDKLWQNFSTSQSSIFILLKTFCSFHTRWYFFHLTRTWKMRMKKWKVSSWHHYEWEKEDDEVRMEL